MWPVIVNGFIVLNISGLSRYLSLVVEMLIKLSGMFMYLR